MMMIKAPLRPLISRILVAENVLIKLLYNVLELEMCLKLL